MSARPTGVALALAVLALAVPAVAQQDGTSIRLRVPQAQYDVLAGSRATVSIQAVNVSMDTVTIRPAVAAPPSWQVVIPTQAVTIPPGHVEPQYLILSTPINAEAGRHPLRYSARIERSTDTVAATLYVNVLQRRELTLVRIAAPERVVAGSTYETVYVLRNAGNVPVNAVLSVVSTNNFPARVDHEQVHLLAGEQRQIRVRVDVPSTVDRAIDHFTNLIATTDLDPDVQARGGAGVHVLSKVAKAASWRHPYPLRLEVSGAGHRARTGLQTSIYGAGTLFDTNRHYLAFAIQPPATGTAVLDYHGQYWATYRTGGLTVEMGDRTFSLSHLTERYAYGFGAGAQYLAGDWYGSAFANQNRFLPSSSLRTGVQIGRRVTSTLQVSSQFMRRNHGDETAASLLARYAPSAALHLEGEVGVGDAGMGPNRAVILRAEGDADVLEYDVRLQHVGREYPTFDRGLGEQRAWARLKPVRFLAFDALYQHRSRSWTSPLLGSARQTSRSLQGGAVFSATIAGAGTALGIRWHEYRTMSGIELTAPLQRTRAWQLSPSLSYGPVSLHASTTLGTTQAFRHGATYPYREYVARGTYRIRGGRTASAMTRYLNGSLFGLTAPMRTFQTTFTLGTDLGPRTTSRVSFSMTETGVDRRSRFFYGTVDVRHRFPAQQALRLRLHLIGTQKDRVVDNRVLLTYERPLNVPLTPPTKTARIRGRLIDESSGSPLRGVPVFIGSRAVTTDEGGAFEIARLDSGTYYLTVDQTAIGLEKVALSPLPLAITVHHGDDVRQSIRIVDGAVLAVRVVQHEYEGDVRFADADLPTRETGGLNDVAVQIVNMRDGTSVTTKTDRMGEVVFSGLRPGPYRMAITAARLPEHHLVSDSVFTTTLAAGQRDTVSFPVLPVRRALTIVDQGAVAVQKAPPDRDSAPAMDTTIVQTQVTADSARTEQLDAPTHYTVEPGITSLMMVAQIVYEDESLWPKIWLANLQRIPDPDHVPAALTLEIPIRAPLTDVEQEARDLYLRERGRLL